MLCYKDKCYCMASNKVIAKNNNIEYCDNTKCYRHCIEIPFDKLPEYMLVSYSDFSKVCNEFKKEN